jgi:hypothetical protein
MVLSQVLLSGQNGDSCAKMLCVKTAFFKSEPIKVVKCGGGVMINKSRRYGVY